MTTIEWTHQPGFKGESWNFITGCSLGCHYCYAAAIARRFWGDRQFSDVRFHPERLPLPHSWRKPRCVFVNSMGDWADPGVEIDWLRQGFETMNATRRHRYLLLTKQPERGAALLQEMGVSRVPANIWLGVSVENQAAANSRREGFRSLARYTEVPWVSYEPALGDVNWDGWEFLRWLVIGGSSSGDPFNLAWAERAIAWARQYAVSPYVKQVGNAPYGWPHDERWEFTGKGSNPDEWPEELRVREIPIAHN